MNEKIELYALVELFGHQKIAGTITEHSFGPSTFIRIDVPETENQPAFTRLVNPSAVYAINPVTKEVMESLVLSIQAKPIDSWDIRKMQEKLILLTKGQGGQPVDEDNEAF
jgi:hypothetical protein